MIDIQLCFDKAGITPREVIDYHGNSQQVDKTIEEMSELMKELLKCRIVGGSAAAITEEMADCHVMFHQLMTIYDIEPSDIEQVALAKIHRLKRRIYGDR